MTGRGITDCEEEIILVTCVKTAPKKEKKKNFQEFCSFSFMWNLSQKAELCCRSDSPRCVLQSASNFTHLLFPKIHHSQMYPAILTNTDFPVHKGWDIRDKTLYVYRLGAGRG